ncbi:hypothetical protein AB0C29_05650 [Actinoplanes sp. NPDC048791]
MRRWFMLAAATLALKAALDHPAWYALVVAGYVAAFAFWPGACAWA